MQNPPVHRFFYYFTYGLTVLVLVTGLIPVSVGGFRLPGLDKVLHMGTYCTLCFFYLKLFPGSLIRVMGSLFLYGLFIEVLQGMTSYRSFEWLDLVANGSGLVLGEMLAVKLAGNRKLADCMNAPSWSFTGKKRMDKKIPAGNGTGEG